MSETAARASILIVGVGNRSRSDDGAGSVIARAVRRARLPGVEAIEVGGDVSRLLDACEGRDAVVVVDAARSGAPPGTVHRLDAATVATLRRHGTSSHGFGVAEAVALANATGRLPARFEVVAIEGGTFAVGTRRTPVVARACREVVREIVERFRGPN